MRLLRLWVPLHPLLHDPTSNAFSFSKASLLPHRFCNGRGVACNIGTRPQTKLTATKVIPACTGGRAKVQCLRPCRPAVVTSATTRHRWSTKSVGMAVTRCMFCSETTTATEKTLPAATGSFAGDGAEYHEKSTTNNVTDRTALGQIDEEDTQKMNVAQLKEVLRHRGLKVSGKKRDLIDRLLTSCPTSEDHRTSPAFPTRTVCVGRKRARETRITVDSKPPSKANTNSSRHESTEPRVARESIDRGFTSRPSPLKPDTPQLRVLSWNVNGIRALLGKEEGREALATLVAKERPHVFGLQETKIQVQHVEEMTKRLTHLLPEYTTFWYCSEPPARRGYSGTAVAVRTLSEPERRCTNFIGVQRGIGQDDGDAEGRVLTVELESTFVVNVYTPNSGDGLKRLRFRTDTWDREFASFLSELEKEKPVVVIGDLNVAHEDIDFFNPTDKRMRKAAGTTPEERRSFAVNLLGREPMSDSSSCVSSTEPAEPPSVMMALKNETMKREKRNLRMLDTFRVAHPAARGVFSYWSARARNRPFNRGMRLDYCLVSEAPAKTAGTRGTYAVHDAFVLDEETIGFSDHCPVGVALRL